MALCFLDTLKTQPLWVLVLCILGSLSIFKSSLRFLNWVYLNFLRLAKNLKKYESSALASSSSSSVQVQQKFQVFLSFRGEDTRINFTSHLHEALKKKGIDTYVDYRLEKGEKIDTLFTVIQESKISIIVLSENYASSSWCLDELCKILECKKTMGHKVVPIFYHVDPSDVRHIRGSFKKALEKQFWLKLRIYLGFKDRADKVERWRAAFVEVGGLAGHHLRGQPNDRLESKVIEEIARDISKKLKCNSSVDTRGLVGMDSRVEKIESLLCFDSKDVRIVGIWGMGGIGKTTIAEVVYNRFFAEFEGYCFINVTEGELKYGRVPLQQKIFSEILGDENLNVGTSLPPAFISDRLQHKKVFIVLDDVNVSNQLDLLSLKFGSGSRIIVTSRNKQLLETIRVCVKHVRYETYEVRGLIGDEALELFSLYAFGEKRPNKDFVELSKEAARCVDGVPLALRVFGSSLCGKPLELWKGYLKKLNEFPNREIENVLKISYDGLDTEEQNIFLDIACFFNGENRGHVEDILDGCYKSPKVGMVDLIDRSLLFISSDNMIKMHDLLQQMAWNIIRQESEEFGKRSRLWTFEDIYPVLQNNTGTESVKGMLLDMSKLRRRVSICPTAFAGMRNLKFLKFYYSNSERETKLLLENGLVSLPNTLCYLQWDEYPSKSLPSNFCPESLVKLIMPNSLVERLWDGVQNLVNLKFLALSGSQYLIETPDLSKATNLEVIILNGCKKLENFQGSVLWRSLNYLSLEGCSNITKFPEIPDHRSSLQFILSRTAIEEVPSSIGRASPDLSLNLSYCRRLQRLPSSICKWRSLNALYLKGCLKLESFPEISETMKRLIWLDLSHTSIEELPIENLVHLSFLRLDCCEKFKNFPSSFRELESLEDLRLINCSNVTKFLEIPLNLRYLYLGGTSIEQLPSSMDKFLQLERLDLRYCKRLQSLPPELPPKLRFLDAHGCESLEKVSSELPISVDMDQIFLFINCHKLDLNCINWVKTPLSIRHKAIKDVNLFQERVKRREAIKDVNLFQEKVEHLEDDDEDCVLDDSKDPYRLQSSLSISFSGSGSEIPKWFGCKSWGSSVTIQLPPHLHHDNNFVGFAVCVVLAFRYKAYRFSKPFFPFFSLQKAFGVLCRYKFNTNGDYFFDINRSYIYGSQDFPSLEHPKSIDSNIVLISYNLDFYRTWYKEKSKHHLTEASFEFSVHIPREELSDYFVVKECGVCLLCAKDDFPHRPSEPLVIQPSSSYDPNSLSLKCGVINQDSVDPLVEEEEPQHKRLKYS